MLSTLSISFWSFCYSLSFSTKYIRCFQHNLMLLKYKKIYIIFGVFSSSVRSSARHPIQQTLFSCTHNHLYHRIFFHSIIILTNYWTKQAILLHFGSVLYNINNHKYLLSLNIKFNWVPLYLHCLWDIWMKFFFLSSS